MKQVANLTPSFINMKLIYYITKKGQEAWSFLPFLHFKNYFIPEIV